MRVLVAMGAGLGLLVLHCGAAEAGAWGRTLGEGYVKAAIDAYGSLRYIDLGGTEGRRYFGLTPSLYAEVGLTPGWPVHVAIHLPATFSVLRFTDRARFGPDAMGTATSVRPGDLRLTAHVQLWARGLQVAVEGELKVPLYENGRVGQRFGAWQAVFPLPGDGQIDAAGLVLVGGGLGPSPLWAEGAVGYLHRTEWFVGWDPPDKVGDGWIVRAKLGFGIRGGGFSVGLDSLRSFVPDEVTKEHLSVVASLWLPLAPGLCLELRASVEPWARNATQGVGFGVGLSRRWSLPAMTGPG